MTNSSDVYTPTSVVRKGARGSERVSARISIEQPGDADLDVVHGVLTQSYWSPGVPREVVGRARVHN